MITDSLRGEIERIGKLAGYRSGPLEGINTLSYDLALAAYSSSGMMKKVITIPAEDKVREWRDWQAEADQITLLEKEEKRLDLVNKTKEAETLRGIGGGAIIIVTAGEHSKPLTSVNAGGIIALPVVSRWQIQAKGWHEDISDPNYGTPVMWELTRKDNGAATLIHPSRVIAFRGSPLPCGSATTFEDAFWGDIRMMRVFREVTRSDESQGWFAELVRKAKLLRIGMPNLEAISPENLASRIALIASSESVLNATVFRAPGGADDPGETIADYQITWAGIPAMMDAFDQRVAAVSDIPFTRLMGRSPAGMNATGDHDTLNWNRTVKTGQELEVRPCLEKLDPFLIASAGAKGEITWRWAPLSVPSEVEEATTFKTNMEAIAALQATGAIPEEAFNKGVQNFMAEREYVPGLDQALSEIPEDIRFGISADNDGGNPSALQAGREVSNPSAGGGPE